MISDNILAHFRKGAYFDVILMKNDSDYGC